MSVMKNTTRKVAAKDAGAELQRLEENGLAVLTGPFVEAYVRVYGGTAELERAARQQFLAPLLAHVDEAGLGHVSEVADGDAPHTPGGCPFQAWSLGELLRLERVVLADQTPVVTAPREPRKDTRRPNETDQGLFRGTRTA